MKYNVYAIGNALVDIEYHVDESKLSEMNIEKGVMTLINEHQQNNLLNYLGENHEKMTCGGSAANSLIALAQMGGSAFFNFRVADDMAGQFFIKDLQNEGVQTDHKLDESKAGITGKCLVFVTPDADRTMNTFLGDSSKLDESSVSTDAIKQSEYIYIEGYLVSEDCTRKAAIHAKHQAQIYGVKSAITLSDPGIVTYFREGILEMIGDGVDLLFANEDEAKQLTQCDDLDQSIEAIKKYAKTFAITLGAEGAVVFDGESLTTIQPHAVEAIDTLGAGDMFAGAFLYGLTHEMNYQQAGQLASMASSKIVTQFGPRLNQQDCMAVLNSHES